MSVRRRSPAVDSASRDVRRRARSRHAAAGAALMQPRERIDAGWIPPWLRYQHESRYAWAAERCRGLAVLDCACANGYGSRMLIDAGAARVCGVDVELEAVCGGEAILGVG